MRDLFTKRENETADLLIQGCSNAEISQAMGIELVTVKLNMRNMCAKLGVKSRLQAALKIQKSDLTTAKKGKK